MKKIIILLFLLCSFSICFADTSAIKNISKSPYYVYTEINYSIAVENADSGNLFVSGIYNDSGIFIESNQSIKSSWSSVHSYMNNPQITKVYYENTYILKTVVFYSKQLELTYNYDYNCKIQSIVCKVVK